MSAFIPPFGSGHKGASVSIPLFDSAVTGAYIIVSTAAGWLAPVGGAATAIVLCTVLIRLLLLPLTVAAVRGERARARLAPKVTELRRRHAKSPQRLSAELAALYRAERVSPFAGYLPMMLQAPFFIVIYRLFVSPRIDGHANVLLAHGLSSRLLTGGPLLVFLPLLIALAGLAWWNARRGRRIAVLTDGPKPPGVLMLLPFGTLVTAFVLPLAAVFYLVTTTAWTAVETAVLRRGHP
jgi:YidC/Oxa1 family membrane protein insertase